MPPPDPIYNLLVELYGIEAGSVTFDQMRRLIDRYRDSSPHPRGSGKGRGKLTQQDSILITYGDQIAETGVKPLRSLVDFCDIYLKSLISSSSHPAILSLFIGRWLFRDRLQSCQSRAWQLG